MVFQFYGKVGTEKTKSQGEFLCTWQMRWSLQLWQVRCMLARRQDLVYLFIGCVLFAVLRKVPVILWVGLIGANGAGKSTLLKLLVGLNMDYSGTIQVGEYPVSKQYLPQIRAKLGYVFQDSDSQLFMSTVYEDVAFVLRNYGLTADETDQRVRQAWISQA